MHITIYRDLDTARPAWATVEGEAHEDLEGVAEQVKLGIEEGRIVFCFEEGSVEVR